MYQHRQIHVWISESDYLMLHEQSDVTRESVSALIRRLIKSERQRLKHEECARMAMLIAASEDPIGDSDGQTSDQSECGRLFSMIQP
jgi:predicted CopG family antitoxin